VSLGLWSALLIYLISIPLGIKKARLHGTVFDQSTSLLLAVAYAVPAFIFAILLIVFFAGGSYFQWFPYKVWSRKILRICRYGAKLKIIFGTWLYRFWRW
jgi:ABC-type microcin C transport system permease subunit YejB